MPSRLKFSAAYGFASSPFILSKSRYQPLTHKPTMTADEYLLWLKSLAAQVFPQPGGPYIITCCGFGPHIAALSALIPSS